MAPRTLPTTTAPDFNGEQFLLWVERRHQWRGIQSLVFFLDPLYPAPTGTNVMTITTNAELTNTASLRNFDTLIFQGNFRAG